MEDRGTPRGIEAGTVVAAVGAIALLVGLFLDWYAFGPGEGASAWTVFEIDDLLLALLGLSVLLAAASAAVPSARMPALPAWTIAGAGVAALVLVVTSMVDDPPAASGASLEEGIWISFGGVVLIVLGAVLERSRIRLVVSTRDERAPEYDEPPGEPDPLYEAAEDPEDTETREFRER